MKDIFIKPDASIKDALKKLDKTAEKTLLVVDENGHLLGTVTDGDIRRYIIKTGSLEGRVEDVYHRNPIVLYENETGNIERIKNLFLKHKIEVLPVINDRKQVINYLTWTEFFSREEKERIGKVKFVNLPVVIMAGGKGRRLAPVTDVIPKPLVPVGNKTMIEHIIDVFRKYGVNKFYMTLNYKGKLIEAYFNSIDRDYDVEFIWEEDYLGTAGSLKLLQDKIDSDFIVSNCDIIVQIDFSDLVEFHLMGKSVLTAVTSIKHYKIPYGVVNVGKDGVINNIEEKPEYTFQINTGVYVLNKRALEHIPENSYFDMTDLIKILIERGEKVLAYPINESNYIDLGQWEEYKKNIGKLEEILKDV